MSNSQIISSLSQAVYSKLKDKFVSGLANPIFDIDTEGGIQTSEAIISKILTIERHLNPITSPDYRTVVMHLKEGNYEKGKARLIRNIAEDELDMASRILYAHLLATEQQYELAIREYVNVLTNFAPNRELIPADITTEFCLINQSSINNKTLLIQLIYPCEIKFDCYQQGVIVTMKYDSQPFVFALKWSDPNSNIASILFQSTVIDAISTTNYVLSTNIQGDKGISSWDDMNNAKYTGTVSKTMAKDISKRKSDHLFCDNSHTYHLDFSFTISSNDFKMPLFTRVKKMNLLNSSTATITVYLVRSSYI